MCNLRGYIVSIGCHSWISIFHFLSRWTLPQQHADQMRIYHVCFYSRFVLSSSNDPNHHKYRESTAPLRIQQLIFSPKVPSIKVQWCDLRFAEHRSASTFVRCPTDVSLCLNWQTQKDYQAKLWINNCWKPYIRIKTDFGRDIWMLEYH